MAAEVGTSGERALAVALKCHRKLVLPEDSDDKEGVAAETVAGQRAEIETGGAELPTCDFEGFSLCCAPSLAVSIVSTSRSCSFMENGEVTSGASEGSVVDGTKVAATDGRAGAGASAK
ncbi:hypothetical protein VNO78_12527 [Psophocarpus tetragonolobus]|uniref:Uncharacterized protein n=1 Tax=Psophocarpus tetragonolobus TaxID=3891 RepID=A0AAN9SQX9_PSOTE